MTKKNHFKDFLSSLGNLLVYRRKRLAIAGSEGMHNIVYVHCMFYCLFLCLVR